MREERVTLAVDLARPRARGRATHPISHVVAQDPNELVVRVVEVSAAMRERFGDPVDAAADDGRAVGECLADDERAGLGAGGRNDECRRRYR